MVDLASEKENMCSFWIVVGWYLVDTAEAQVVEHTTNDPNFKGLYLYCNKWKCQENDTELKFEDNHNKIVAFGIRK